MCFSYHESNMSTILNNVFDCLMIVIDSFLRPQMIKQTRLFGRSQTALTDFWPFSSPPYWLMLIKTDLVTFAFMIPCCQRNLLMILCTYITVFLVRTSFLSITLHNLNFRYLLRKSFLSFRYFVIVLFIARGRLQVT